jgi:hypothetical protein
VVNGFLNLALGQSFWKGFATGAAIGAVAFVGGVVMAPAIASATAAAQTGSILAKAALFTLEAAQWAAAGAVGGGVSSSLNGSSFGEGAGTGALVSVATFGVGKALGPVFNQIGEAIGPQLAQVGQAIASSSAGQQLQRFLAQTSDDAVYAGVRQVSSFLQASGVPRALRQRLLSPLDPRTVGMEFAGANRYGLRYYGGKAAERGYSLFDTFPASRESLAVKLDWNTMQFIKQWRFRPGAPIIYGRGLPQGPGLPGGQMQRAVINLEDLLNP